MNPYFTRAQQQLQIADSLNQQSIESGSELDIEDRILWALQAQNVALLGIGSALLALKSDR